METGLWNRHTKAARALIDAGKPNASKYYALSQDGLFPADIALVGFVRDLQDRAASEKDRLTEKEILFSAGHAYAAATYVLISPPSLSFYHGSTTESDLQL